MKKWNIIFFCSPSLALLDSWLPVLKKLKEKNSGIKITCVFPENFLVKKIDIESTLINLSEDVFEHFIFKSVYGEWYKAGNYKDILEIDQFGFFTINAGCILTCNHLQLVENVPLLYVIYLVYR